jgi:hypothetical protein
MYTSLYTRKFRKRVEYQKKMLLMLQWDELCHIGSTEG